MLADNQIITQHFNNDITIYPISDVHLGAAEHMEREWNDFCEKIAAQENAYIILGGDLINNGTRSSVSLGK